MQAKNHLMDFIDLRFQHHLDENTIQVVVTYEIGQQLAFLAL